MAASADTADACAAAPESPAQLFVVFTRLALQGFGGVMPVTQRALVEHQHWLTRAQFLELLSIAQVLPGPNIVNLALIFGDRHFGWRGALAAMGGVILAPLLLVLVLAVLVQQSSHLPAVGNALRGMGVVAAGLVLSTAVRLVTALRGNALGPSLCGLFTALTVIAIGVLRWPLVPVVLVLTFVSLLFARGRP
jgi:chromate transporter